MDKIPRINLGYKNVPEFRIDNYGTQANTRHTGRCSVCVRRDLRQP